MTKRVKMRLQFTILIILFALMPIITIIPLELGPEIQSPLAVEKKVLAFYYSWYGNTTVYTDPNIIDFSGSSWAHWGGPGFSPPASIPSTNYPELGAYDCSDPDLIKAHFSMAEYAGIDAFICTWWGIGEHSDIAFNNILNMANNVTPSLNFTVYYEAYSGRLLSLPQSEREITMVQELKYILETYSANDYFLKVNNLPVLFIYSTFTSPFSSWSNIFSQVRAEFGPCYFVGDILANHYMDELAQVFDGIHLYNPTITIDFQRMLTGSSEWDVSHIYESMGQTAHLYNKLYAATVIPGYDDRVIRDPGIVVERNGMQTYDKLWETAIQASADWVLITSFNEWHEGTEIESSLEYSDLYLNRTQYWANIFHSGS